MGYTPEQRQIIAAIARYLGKSRPTPGDIATKGLLQAEQEHVAKASMLLRLARAMNLGRSRAVQKARVSMRDGDVKLTLVSRRRTGVDLELWAIEKDRDYFRELFGRELSAAAA